VSLAPEGFDVVYCAFVLEHVEGAELVLDRLVDALRPGGRLILLVPNGQSLVGWAARRFPFRAAVLYKKYVEGFRDAGKPGHAPYPTVYEPVVSLSGIRQYARSRRLLIVTEYGVDYVLENFGRFSTLVGGIMNGIARLSGNRVTASHNNLGFVLQKDGAQASA
jgi:SAM-dependent methyltransferase